VSLDVYLTLKGVQNLPSGEHIFIREDGQNKEISRAEWDKRFPGREPVTVQLPSDDEEVYSANITHNLNQMADAACIYHHLWRPDEIGITKAGQLIEPLRAGLVLLRSNPEIFKKYNPENGWGNYEGLVRFVENYLEACERYPGAEVYASR
jgi:hypothetical protein